MAICISDRETTSVLLSLLFTSILGACGAGEESSEEGCESTTEMDVDEVWLSDRDFAAYLDGNGELSEEACEMICDELADVNTLDESDSFLHWTNCTAAPDAGGHSVECEYSYVDGCAVATAGRTGGGVVCYGEGVGVRPLGRWAAQMAHAEASSVRAFLDLERELRQLGAPAELRRRARAAARDEVVHARAMHRLARRFGGRPAPLRFRRMPRRSAIAIACENAAEGCVRETFAALVASHQARRAADPQIRATMWRIARDETRHAALSHDVDQWFRRTLAASDLRRLDAARVAALTQMVQSDLRSADSLVRLAGMPDEASARALLEGLIGGLWRADATPP